MQGDDFVGHLPSNVYWSSDGKTIYFDWNPEAVYSDLLYACQLPTENIQKVDFDTEYNLPATQGTFNSDETQKIYSKNGDIFIMDTALNAIIPITRTKGQKIARTSRKTEQKGPTPKTTIFLHGTSPRERPPK